MCTYTKISTHKPKKNLITLRVSTHRPSPLSALRETEKEQLHTEYVHDKAPIHFKTLFRLNKTLKLNNL